MGVRAGRASLGMAAAIAVVVAHIALVWGEPVPAGNEHDYLALLRAFWDPSYLANDWTFARILPDRWTFDFMFGGLAALVGVQFVAWAGRLACWVLASHAILKVAGRLGLPLAWAAVAASAWVIAGQSLVGKEWMVGTFEAKTVAYVAWLYALDLVLADRLVPAAALSGLAVTMHPVVGAVGGVALAAGAVVLHGWRRDLWKPAIVGALAAAPGVVQAVAMAGGSEAGVPSDWRFLAKGPLEGLLDLPTFARGQVALQIAAAAAAVAWALSGRAARGFRAIAWALAVLLVPVAAGVAAHATGEYRLLSITPFRLFPVVGLLAFFLALGAALASRATLPRVARAGVVALALAVAVALMPAYRAMGARLWGSWTRAPDDMDAAFAFVAAGTPEGAVVLAPPWRQDSMMKLGRGQVMHWSMPRYDRLAEWRRRAEALVGPAPEAGAGRDPAAAFAARRAWYDALSPDDVRRLAAEYGASFIVAEREYPFPTRFVSGEARVYEVPR